MSGEKQLWRLSTPFRGSPRKQDLPSKTNVGNTGGPVSSVYLSDDFSTNGFTIVPEFDNPIRPEMTPEKSNYTSYVPNSPIGTCSGLVPPDGVDDCLYEAGSLDSNFCFNIGGDSVDTSVVNTSQDHDFTQRLGSAYEHIRSMPSAVSSKTPLSSDPQMLRKQLGVPQHSVLNYPISSAPHLPNPHPATREPRSPRPLPLPPSGVLHAGTSKKLESLINRDIPSSCNRHFPDTLQPAKRRSLVAAPNSPDNPLSEPSTPGQPGSASHSSKPRSTKFVERHIDNTILSPSSRRQISKEDSWKSADSTLPSKHAFKGQALLPQIRPPSPFKVDIPLHHAWHDRRTDFNSPPERHSKMLRLRHETKLRRISGSTDVLASLAWIGISPTESNYGTANGEPRLADSASLPDRLSMAIAVEDDNISDDALVDQLEKVRRIGDPPDRHNNISSSRPSTDACFRGNGHPPTSLSSPPPHSIQLASPCDVPPPSSNDMVLDSDDAAIWQAARKALLCVREIIRTERRYQEALKMLLNAETATPPPPSMAPYVSALVRASETLLKCYLEDPSAWGVSTAFVTSEDELEATMVSWCAVAGGFFTDGSDPRTGRSTGKWRLRKPGMMSGSSTTVTKQTTISSSPQPPHMLSMTSTAAKVKEQTVRDYCAGQHPQPGEEKHMTSQSLQSPDNTHGQIPSGQPPSRKLSVRDLAIQPIQRVMRYVLLYRDLLHCTPSTSPSRLLVERALETAARIAKHCDKAQRNPAFFRPP